MEYDTVIGLEIHVQLSTHTKAFCNCSTRFGALPNAQTCPVCLGFPGVLPVLNKKALEYAYKVALALNCKISKLVKFDRKNYFYPDLPKNYQISQYGLPLSFDGYLEIHHGNNADSLRKDIFTGVGRIGIIRVHLEEDAGKLIHPENANYSLVDFNRSGIPLLEIVTKPDISSPEEGYNFLNQLKTILEYLDVSDCNMEEGSLRCDANISIKPKGEHQLGVKAEVKNMNSFKAVREALRFELKRQKEILKKGDEVIPETRLWDEAKSVTASMRAKEGVQDYRYFPEPDLAPFVISQEEIEQLRKKLPELADKKKERFIQEYNLPTYDANVLTQNKRIAQFYESCVKIYSEPKLISNWIMSEILAYLKSHKIDIDDLKLKPSMFVELLKLYQNKIITAPVAKEVLLETIQTEKSPCQIVKEKRLEQLTDKNKLEEIIEEVIKNNPKSCQDFLSGKERALMFLVGAVMKATKGKAAPEKVQNILRDKLKSGG